MKVIKERILKIQYVVPESDSEMKEIQKIISEVKDEKIDTKSLKRAEAGQPVED